MTTLTLTGTNAEELAVRQNNGITVTLLWHRGDNSLAVRVVDAAADETMWLDVEPHEAMDVFDHPYAHAAFRGIGCSLGTHCEAGVEDC